MNDCLAIYIERDVIHKIYNVDIMQRFQNMKSCIRQYVKFQLFGYLFILFDCPYIQIVFYLRFYIIYVSY